MHPASTGAEDAGSGLCKPPYFTRPGFSRRMYEFFRTALFKLDPERAHYLAAQAAKLGQGVGRSFVEKQFAFEDPRLQVKAWGLTFPNPIGLAAGFDKNARLVPFWESIGFGFAEVGSVTARRSKGNPKPRLFRLPDDEALVNRLGLRQPENGIARSREEAIVVAERIGQSRIWDLAERVLPEVEPAAVDEAWAMWRERWLRASAPEHPRDTDDWALRNRSR